MISVHLMMGDERVLSCRPFFNAGAPATWPSGPCLQVDFSLPVNFLATRVLPNEKEYLPFQSPGKLLSSSWPSGVRSTCLRCWGRAWRWARYTSPVIVLDLVLVGTNQLLSGTSFNSSDGNRKFGDCAWSIISEYRQGF